MTFTVSTAMLDFLILAVIAQGDTYGYEISQKIKLVSDKKDSTMYPILKRLQEAGWVTTYDQQFQGRNRRYYRITESGVLKYRESMEEWELYKKNIDLITKKDEGSNQMKNMIKPVNEMENESKSANGMENESKSASEMENESKSEREVE